LIHFYKRAMEAILSRLLEPDNQVIKAATEDLRAAFKQPGVIPELCGVLGSSQKVQIRQYAAVLLRKKFSKSGSWFKFSLADRSQLKSGCLASLVAEPEKTVRNALAQLIGTLARHELGQRGGGWPELLQLVLAKVGSGEGQDRVLGVMVMSVLGEEAGEQVTANLKEFLQMFRKTLEDPELEVCYFTIVALTHFVRRTGSEEVVLFQQLIPAVLNKVEAIAGVDQDKAVIAIDIFDELIESEVAIVVPHIKPIVELCIRLSQNQDMDDSIRIKCVTFLGRLTRLKKKTIVKHKLYIPMIQVIFSIMAQQDLPDEFDDEDAEDDDDSPALAASQSLDILALNLPPEKYITALLTQVQPALCSPSPGHQRAAYQAIAVSAEGCQEHIRTKYLQNFLQIMGTGIRHELPVVRNSALYMLGQFSEFIQPEISNHAPEILPVLLEYLDTALATLTPQGKDPSTVSRIFYALETFCENLEMKLVPHLELIMSRAIQAMSDQFSVRIQELAISLVGAASNATKGAIVPYMGVVVPRLEHYLTMQHNDDTQVLLTQSMATLGTLARAVGEQHFSKEFAEKCINIGLELVKSNDDPDVRKCAYSLFGAVASVVKEGMGTELVGMLVDLMLKSVQNTEGINLELEDNDTNIPLEELSDEEDIESNADDTDKALDDLEGIKSVSVENSYVAEKECAVIALKDLSTECGTAFYPFLAQSVEEIGSLLEYPDYDVRCAAIEATGYFLIAYHKSGTQEGAAKFSEEVGGYLTRLVELVVEEDEHQVVIAALDSMTELLKQCKSAVTVGDGHCEKIVSCVQKIMKGECACQDAEAEESGEEEEAEQDEMLFEYAGEVLPNLGRALTPQTFAPYFTGLLQMLLKKTKKQCSIAERSFAIGAIADSIEPLTGVLEPFLPHLLPVFSELTKDTEDDCRNNAVYGLGELMLWGGPAMDQHYQTILGRLSQLLQVETAPRVVDQIVGAVARAVVANISKIPVEELVTAILANLPLKEDMDEYDIVFKFFNSLFMAQHGTFASCLPKIVECSAAFFSSHATDKEKTSPQVVSLLKQAAGSFGGEMQALVSALPAEQAQLVANAIQN